MISISFNGVDVANDSERANQLKKVNAGDTVEMVVYRSGEEVTLSVTLDEKPQTTETDSQQSETQQRPEGYIEELPDDFGSMEDFFNYYFNNR